MNNNLDQKGMDFRLNVKLSGADFQKKVWNELRQIWFGETITYKDMAQCIVDINSYRSVGI